MRTETPSCQQGLSSTRAAEGYGIFLQVGGSSTARSTWPNYDVPPIACESAGRGACAAVEARANGGLSPSSPYGHVRIPGLLWPTERTVYPAETGALDVPSLLEALPVELSDDAACPSAPQCACCPTCGARERSRFSSPSLRTRSGDNRGAAGVRALRVARAVLVFLFFFLVLLLDVAALAVNLGTLRDVSRATQLPWCLQRIRWSP